MRPTKLILQNFGPYKNRETVDFNELAGQGLFLICGETGSGKTMILDAMTFALYGKSSGNLRDDFEALRYKGGAKEVPTLVRFEFEHYGDIYAFERKLEMRRINLAASQNVYKRVFTESTGEQWLPLFENCRASDIEAKAVELTGLKYDQFRQVIVLPQGQFERFLVSNSEDKEKILSCIFGVDKWQRIAEIMYASAREHYDGLKARRDEIDNRLKDENCATVDEFSEACDALKNELKELRDTFKEFDCERRKAEADRLLELAGRFSLLHEAEKKLNAHEAGRDIYTKQVEGLNRSEKADALRPAITAATEAKQRLVERTENEAKALRNAETAVKEAAKAEKEYGDILNRKPRYEADKARKTTLEGKKNIYSRLRQCETEEERCLAVMRKTAADYKKADEINESVEKRVETQRNRYLTAQAVHTDILNRYLHGISGILAADLKEGVPCPVCGSISHPAPATGEEDCPGKDEVDISKASEDSEYAELKNAMEDSRRAKEILDAAREAANEAVTAEKLAGQALANVREALEEGITSSEGLQKELERLERTIFAYEEELARADSAKNKAAEAKSAADNASATAVSERRAAEEAQMKALRELEEALKEKGFSDMDEASKYLITESQKKQCRDFISRYKADGQVLRENIEKLKSELEGIEEPNAEAVRAELKKIEDTRVEFVGGENKLQERLERMTVKLSELTVLKNTVDLGWKQAEDDMAVVRNLRGDTGVGLQRYVLGIMFGSVISEANKMLEHVHGGRYRLFTTDERTKGAKKRGLDLKVEDAYYDGTEGRAVNTLSGGEKFLVSLALSIGMSSVASKGGIRIEAMFIDEGFGSLDSDSIEDAIDVLNSVRAANGMVGIISHVQLLRDTIPSKLLVHKSREGSTITRTIG